MPKYKVKQGEDIESIAKKFGLFWETVWNDPKNAKLGTKLKTPNQLLPGDVIFILEKSVKEESGATGQRHQFRRKGVPSMLRLQLLDEGKPRANETYVLNIDGDLFTGTTDKNGMIEQPIPPDAKQGKLLIGEDQEEYLLYLNYIDPINEISGVQGRLLNLGFDCGEIDGVLGPETEATLKEFQQKYKLFESGKIDEATRNKLLEVHGS